MIGVLGGTFDPIHFGHIKPAMELLKQLPLEEIRFIPCRIPPHRSTPVASAEERWQMVNLVVEHQAGLSADARELRRDGPSYSVDTLQDLRAELGASTPIGFIMGYDAFCTLPQWYHWEKILELAHIIVIDRPGTEGSLNGVLAQLWRRFKLEDPMGLTRAPHGGILSCGVTPVAISSSDIRACIGAGESPSYMLPGVVWAYIKRHGLYT